MIGTMMDRMMEEGEEDSKVSFSTDHSYLKKYPIRQTDFLLFEDPT